MVLKTLRNAKYGVLNPFKRMPCNNLKYEWSIKEKGKYHLEAKKNDSKGYYKNTIVCLTSNYIKVYIYLNLFSRNQATISWKSYDWNKSFQ